MTDDVRAAYSDGLTRISAPVLATSAHRLGLNRNASAAVVPFFDQVYHVEPGKIVSADGHCPTDAVGLVLCRYLLNCPPEPPPKGSLITFRELEGAGPLVSSFATNTNKLITDAFASDPKALERAAENLKGRRRRQNAGYDVCIVFQALPLINIDLRFNAADEQFPAQCGLFFNQSAEVYLDMRSLFTLGTYLAGGLTATS